MTTPKLHLTPEQWKRIETEGERAFPNECCGILFGVEKSIDGKIERFVDELEPVQNDFEAGEQYHRFSITPKTLMAAEKKCGRGRVVLGFYHSHPDHPARPSEYDRVHAWPFYSYVIVAIGQGKAGDLTSWMLDEITEKFESQPVIRPV